MQVTVLGSAGWMPSDGRETTCLACRSGSSLLLFDAGTGLRRLLQPAQAELLDDVERVHLFLTHFHLDHTCGLAYLSGVLPGREIVVHAADTALSGVDPERAAAGLLRRPYNPRNWGEIRELRMEALTEGDNEVAGHTVRVRAQQHSDVSVAYRIDDEFVVATDTIADSATAAFAEGASVLFHEMWYAAADPVVTAMPASLRSGFAAHSEAAAVAELAATAGVRLLVALHLNPLLSETSYASIGATARRTFAPTVVPADGTRINTKTALPVAGAV